MVSWLVLSFLDQAVQDQILAGDIVFLGKTCYTLIEPLSTQACPGWSRNTPSHFMLQKLGYAQASWVTWLIYNLYFIVLRCMLKEFITVKAFCTHYMPLKIDLFLEANYPVLKSRC